MKNVKIIPELLLLKDLNKHNKQDWMWILNPDQLCWLWDTQCEWVTNVWGDRKHAAISAKVQFTEFANMHVYDQALFKEVLACSFLNLRQQMFLGILFASQGDLRPGRRGSSFCYLSTLENLQPTLCVSWPSFHVSPAWSWESDDALVLHRLHKDLLCLVCLHPVTARSVFKQTHTPRPRGAVFHINPPFGLSSPAFTLS